MTADRPRRSLAELHATSNRLWYDYWMLRCTARARSDDPAIAAALEESFALHVLNLHEFLYAPDGSDDAVRVEDFLGHGWTENRPERSALVMDIVSWASQKLTGVTQASTSAVDARRGWTLVQASFELQKLTDPFISSLPRELLGDRWKIDYEGGLSV